MAKLRYILAHLWKRVRNNWIIRIILSPIITGVFTTIALNYYSSAELKQEMHNSWPVVARALDCKVFMTMCLAVAWTPCANALRSWLDSNCKQCLDIEARVICTLLNCIDDVVGCKALRFREVFEQLKATGLSPSPDQIFNNITQPDEQIKQLAQAVLTFFSSINNEPDCRLRVSLIAVSNKKLERFIVFYPRNAGPESTIESLQNPESAAHTAIDKKVIHIVPDTRKEGNRTKGKRQFVITDPSRRDENGSMFCYPIKHPFGSQCVMVVCVCSNIAGYFSKDKRHLYEFVMQRIEDRMQLEWTLKLLKESQDHAYSA